MIDFKWLCKCGTIIKKEDIKKVHGFKLKDGTIWNGNVCPACNAIVINRITKCRDCGKKLYSGIGGGIKLRCEKHAKKHTYVLVKAAKKRRKAEGKLPPAKRKKPVPKVKYSDRGQYCLGMPICEQYPHCDGCKWYCPIFRGVDPAIRGVWA